MKSQFDNQIIQRKPHIGQRSHQVSESIAKNKVVVSQIDLLQQWETLKKASAFLQSQEFKDSFSEKFKSTKLSENVDGAVTLWSLICHPDHLGLVSPYVAKFEPVEVVKKPHKTLPDVTIEKELNLYIIIKEV